MCLSDHERGWEGRNELTGKVLGVSKGYQRMKAEDADNSDTAGAVSFGLRLMERNETYRKPRLNMSIT